MPPPKRTKATEEKEPNYGIGGSPNDPTFRRELKVEDLDLHKSYVKELKRAAEAQKKPKGPRQHFKYDGPKPMADITLLPDDWNSNEPDLDDEDWDAQIKRCKERIEEGLMTHAYEAKLKGFEEAKAREAALIKSVVGDSNELYSMAVIKRLATLMEIQEDLETKDDKTKTKTDQLPNVKALVKAYRSHELEWHEGLITYWSHGKKLCEPRPFDWDEFEAVNNKYEGHKGFWVEGSDVEAAGTKEANAIISFTPRGPGQLYYYNVACRFPNFAWWHELEFMWDTGSSLMTMYEGDIRSLMGPQIAPQGFIPGIHTYHGPRVLGVIQAAAYGGNVISFEMVQIEVCLLDDHRKRMTPWIRRSVGMMMGLPPVPGTGGAPRLDDNWLRHCVPGALHLPNRGTCMANLPPMPNWVPPLQPLWRTHIPPLTAAIPMPPGPTWPGEPPNMPRAAPGVP
ncbi:hypothetical protein N7467_007879 [Penicillium canescens]|nr:hypothetical protein N7467_007879 [Penicillium canescens]